MSDFDGKNIIVTGGAKGIGKCISKEFAKQGGNVFIADIDKQALEIVKNEIEALKKGKVYTFECDVSDESSVKSLIENVVKIGGDINILVNDAANANSMAANIFEETMEKFDQVIATNLRGTFMCAKFSFPHMKPGSSIINMASTRALMSEAGTEAYSASKGGIVALTHSMAISLGPKGIRVNAISPGWIDVSSSEWRPNGQQEVLTEADHIQHPVGRVGNPYDIANMVLYLASEKSSFITGQNFVIDGGMTKKMIYV